MGDMEIVAAAMNLGELRNRETGRVISERLRRMEFDRATIQDTRQIYNGGEG